MSFADFQERLERSIRVRGLPAGYDKDEVLNNLKNAGTIEDTKLGTTEMIVIYSSANEKDLSKMYDGCPIGDYVINLEDPTSFELDSDQTKPEELTADTGATQATQNYESQAPVHQEYQEPEVHQAPEIQYSQPPVQEPVAEPRHEEPEPLLPAEVNAQPIVEKTEPVHTEPVHTEPKVEAPVERKPEAPVERKPEVPVERKPEAPVERKPEAPVEKKVEAPVERRSEASVERKSEAPVERRTEAAVSHPDANQQRGGDSTKNLLRDLQNTNLPARAGLPEGDAFRTVTKRSFLLIFTMVWGLQLFLRSVF